MRTKKNKFTAIVGDITSIKGDVVLNWTTSSLNSGPDTFYALHQAAGPQLIDLALPFKDMVKPGDAFSTLGCWLPYYAVIHCVLPETWVDWSYAARNIVATLKTYKQTQLVRNIYIPFHNPKCMPEFIAQLIQYSDLIEDIEFVFVCSFPWEVERVFAGFKTNPMMMPPTTSEKTMGAIDRFFKKIVSKISFKSSSALLLKKQKNRGHNKKKF